MAATSLPLAAPVPLNPSSTGGPASPLPDGASTSASHQVSSEAIAAAAVDPDPDSDAREPQLDANKLHVYAVALELHVLCATLVSLLNRVVRDQLERASLSVVLNTAEAGGRRSRRDKARFYMIARGSATEVAALLDVLERRRLASPAALATGRRLAIRAVQMLTRLGQRLA
jgi:four helix bundle protein